MPSYIMRVWMPDRPGALGAVASRIGAVRGDLWGIDILERGGGRAIDELVVHLPDAELLPLLIEEVGEVDGVDVEDVRAMVSAMRDPRLAALETAATLVEQTSPGALLETLVDEAEADFETTWVMVVDLDASAAVVTAGETPPVTWVTAFVHGMGTAAAVSSRPTGPDDVACAALPRTSMALVLGRTGRPFRSRERRQLAALASIAGARWLELGSRAGLRSHPSAAI